MEALLEETCTDGPVPVAPLEHVPIHSDYEERPMPLEQSNPELAEQFRLIANGIHPVVQALNVTGKGIAIGCKNGDWIFKSVHGVITIDKDGRKTAKLLDQNDPCGCGSGKKYKRCCLSKQ